MLRQLKKPVIVFFLILFGLFCFTQSASAWWGEDLANWISTRPFFFIFEMIARLMNLIAGLSGVLLNWVLSPKFTDLSYTNPAGNPVIDAGLSITRSFVNMLLVLVLVYIAIATILQLAGYETKKLLVTFIVVALLVNFAPVICGLIVDASNIVMNFFVQDLKADAFGKTMGNHILTIKSSFSKTTEIEDAWGYIFRIAVFSVMLSGLILFLLLFTILFILRYLTIWLLVILSPLAFVCYILPATKKYFEMWWKQFLAWSFIGVTCGFFLYLSLLLATQQNIMSKITKPTGIGNEGGEPFFNSILPLIVPVIFLGVGFVFGLKTSAMGAEAAIGYAKSIGGKTAKGVAKGAYRSSAWAIDQARDVFQQTKLGQKVKVAGEKLMAAKRWGEGKAGITGFAKRTADMVNPWRWTKKGAGRLLAGTTTEKTQEKVKKAEDSIKDSDRLPIVLKKYHDAVTDTERLGILNKVVERGDFGDATDKKKFGDAAIDEKEAERMYKRAKGWDSDKTLKKAVPHIAASFVTNEELSEAKEKDPTIRNAEDFIVSKMKTDDYDKISVDTLKKTKIVDAIIRRGMKQHINKLIDKHGQIAAEAIEKEIQYQAGADNMNPGEWLKKNNKKLKSYFDSSAGQGMISVPEPLSKLEFEKEVLTRIAENAKKTKELDKKINKKADQGPSGRNLNANQPPYGRKQP